MTISHLPSPFVAWAACCLLAGPACSMTLLVGSTDLEPGHVSAVADATGRLVPSGTGFIAVGAFGDLDDSAILAAAGHGGAMQEVLGRFQQLGAAQRFGLGQGLGHIDGAFQASVSAPTRTGDGLVGRPIYVVGGTENGLFIFKSSLKFEADHPVATGTVDVWGDALDRAGGLLVGSMGESLEVLELGSSGRSLRLAAVDGPGLDLSRFESTMTAPEPPEPPAPIPAPDEPATTHELPQSAADTADIVSPVLIPPVFKDDPVPDIGEIALLPIELTPIDWWVDSVWPRTGVRNGDGSGLFEIQLFDGVGLEPWNGWVYQMSNTSFAADAAGFSARGVAPVFVPEPGCLVLVAGGGLLMWRRSRSSAARRAT